MMKATSVTRSPLVLVLAMLGGAHGHRATPQRRGALAAVAAMLCVLALPGVAHAAPADSWTAVAPMPTPRYDLAATTGPDGRIYAIGGSSSGSDILATVEAYTPSTNSWTAVAPMPTARADLAAAMGPDGRIYAIGGSNPSGVLATVEAYTPLTIIATVGTTVSPIEGATYSGTVASFTDSDGNTQASAYTATITWGDGTTAAGIITATGSAFTVAGSHSYAEEGTAPLTVQITDTDGSMATASSTTTVTDAALTATGTTATRTGRVFRGTVARFTDADSSGAVADYTATITWGDGNSSAGTLAAGGGAFTVGGAHSYLRYGRYALHVTIRDHGGSTTTAQTTLDLRR